MGYGLYDVTFQEGPHEREGVFLVRGELSAGQEARILRLAQFLYLATNQSKPPK